MLGRALRVYGYISPELAERFWGYVDDSAGDEACWTWTGGHVGSGYPNFAYGGNGSWWNMAAHKLAYILAHPFTTVEEQHVVHHKCRKKWCMNFRHMELLSDQATHISERVYDHNVSRGESHVLSRLSDGQIVEVRSLYKAGVKVGELARRYGYSHSTISAIVHRKTWRHI